MKQSKLLNKDMTIQKTSMTAAVWLTRNFTAADRIVLNAMETTNVNPAAVPAAHPPMNSFKAAL